MVISRVPQLAPARADWLSAGRALTHVRGSDFYVGQTLTNFDARPIDCRSYVTTKNQRPDLADFGVSLAKGPSIN
jgi:hypothetical protein